jgi:Fe-S-cluster containining protein
MSAETPATVSVEFKVATREGSFTAQVPVPTGQTNLVQLLPVLQALDDGLVQAATAQRAKEGVHVSCKAGCGACCRQMVPISIFEAEFLANWMRTLPEERQEQLAERFHRGLQALQAAGILERMESAEAFALDDAGREFAIDYLRQQIPCPFLEAESCSIHPIRPLVCREYLVSSPPEHCGYPSAHKPEAINVLLRLARVLNSTAAELEPGTRGWIPLLFLPVWMEKDEHPGSQIAGSGPDVLGKVFQHIAVGQNTET